MIAIFTSHWLAMLGLGLVLTAIVMWACLLPGQLRHGRENPYVGIATSVVAGVLVLGMILAPIGLHLGRRRLKQRIGSLQEGKGAWHRLIAFLLVTSLLNLVITSQATLRVVHHMESRQFCTTCHVHVPEERALRPGPARGAPVRGLPRG